MSAPRFGQRDRRAVIAGSIVIASTILFSRGVPALIAWRRDERAEALEARAALANTISLIAGASAARESTIARGRRVIALAPALLGGETPNAAGASLAGLLSGAAARAGVRLGAVQLRGDSLSRNVFTRIGAHADATGDIRGMTSFFDLLEAGPTMLSVTSFAITQPDPAAGDDRMEVLRLELELEGLMLNPRPPSKP